MLIDVMEISDNFISSSQHLSKKMIDFSMFI